MRKNPRRILSPQRLPFRHPGNRQYLTHCTGLEAFSSVSELLQSCVGSRQGGLKVERNCGSHSAITREAALGRLVLERIELTWRSSFLLAGYTLALLKYLKTLPNWAGSRVAQRGQCLGAVLIVYMLLLGLAALGAMSLTGAIFEFHRRRF